MPPLPRASQRIRYSKKKGAPPERDWAELRPDLISLILHRLDQAELLVGGVAGVCRSWRRAAREQPELWPRVDLREGLWYVPPFRPKISIESMVRKALRLGAGQTEAFLSDGVDNHTLLLLAQRAPSLKSLHLITCSVSNLGFAKAIKMLPLLEELEISRPTYCNTREMVELVAGICLELKHFRLVMHGLEGRRTSARVASLVARMHKLRSLHLVRLKLDNEELGTILDNCHDLEYLDMRECSLVDMDNMDDSPRVKLAQINMDNHEYSSDQQVDYEYKIRSIHYELNYRELRDGSLSYYPDYNDSYEEYCYYIGSGDGIDDADLEQYEKILDVKIMRRYLS
ncbi:hypothetical protein CFC21_082292 [Triticum aestivum]|nr:hypothetical protein CFC21_082292 [Triticum aestivum]